MTVPLPSRRERCRFTLRPISNTVGDFLTMLCHEDRGIDRVAVSSLGGSDSCTIGTVVRQECVSDICFSFQVSNLGGNSFSVSDRIGTVKHMHFKIMQSEDCSLVGCDACHWVSTSQLLKDRRVSLCPLTQRHIPGDLNFQRHLCVSLKCHII